MTSVPNSSTPLLLDENARAQLWRHVADVIEQYVKEVEGQRVAPELDVTKLRSLLEPYNFEIPMNPCAAVDFAAQGLTKHQVHTPHPSYFGLFNPAPTTMGIAADTLVAAFNPQIAAWSHNPFAAEVEHHVIRTLGERFGYPREQVDGVFCSGGAEANHTALLAALTNAFPDFVTGGLRQLPAQPVFYVSGESHHSFVKAARMCGLGLNAVRKVDVDEALRMSTDALRIAIARDRAAGAAAFLVVATAGTTNAGIIDPLHDIAEAAHAEGLWFHVDAAWGGAAALSSRLRPLLAGLESSDSITFDAHKWMSVPMGAGIYVTRHPEILNATFRTETAYMPRDAAGMDIQDPHLHSMQWSRRFIGLKVFLSLLVAGWEGYQQAIDHQTSMGDLLRAELRAAGWSIENRTELPVVCFSDPEGADSREIVARVVSSGEAWISSTILRSKIVLRACITNYRTQPAHVRALVSLLNRTRESLKPQPVSIVGGAVRA